MIKKSWKKMSDFWIFQNLKKPKECKTKIHIISDERTHTCINSLIGPIDMHVKKPPIQHCVFGAA